MSEVMDDINRDSFDRFGDDLCEEILQYLPLNDCFKYQLVSKQFSHKIFTKQTTLSIADSLSSDFVGKRNQMVEELIEGNQIKGMRCTISTTCTIRMVTIQRINQIDNQNENQGENEIENENEVENQIENENEVENQIENENEVENQIENENEVENQIENQRDVGLVRAEFNGEEMEIIREDENRRKIKSLNHKILEYILKKCVNINSINLNGYDLKITDETIDIIRDNCKHLKELYIELNECEVSLNCWTQFAETSLRNLETFKYYCNQSTYSLLHTLLPFTPKLKSIFTGVDINTFFNQQIRDNKETLKSVENVSINDACNELFIEFTDQFKQQIKYLKVCIGDGYDFDVMKRLASFEKLENLCIDFTDVFNNIEFNPILKLVGSKCTKLKQLTINRLYPPFFEIFSDGFQSLAKLEIEISYKMHESIEMLKKCVNLKHLKVVLPEINENAFKDINVFLPQLIAIDINVFRSHQAKQNAIEITRESSKLANLNEFMFHLCGDLESDITEDVMFLLVNCKSIRRIGIDCYKYDKTKIRDYIAANNRRIDIIKMTALMGNHYYITEIE